MPENPSNACRWKFLANEERALAGCQVSTTLELPAGIRPGQQAVSLFQLYKLATRLAPKSNEEPYLQLWLGYARHQGCWTPSLALLSEVRGPFCCSTATLWIDAAAVLLANTIMVAQGEECSLDCLLWCSNIRSTSFRVSAQGV